MKNPINKQALKDTAINVVVGGVANVGIDLLFDKVDMLAQYADKKDWLKVGVGIIGGMFTPNKIVHAATDGIATVGVSNIVSSYVTGSTSDTAAGPAGLPPGTIGAIRRRMGQKGFINRRQVAGVGVPPTAVISK